MKLFLIIPPSSFLVDDQVFPYLGPLQIAAVARENGHNVEIIDASGFKKRHPNFQGLPTEDDIVNDIMDLMSNSSIHKSDFVGFYSTSQQYNLVVKLMRMMRLSNSFLKSRFKPHYKFIIGGPHANLSPNECVEDGFDHVIVSDQGGGGGEEGILKLLNDTNSSAIISEPSRLGVKWENDRWPFPARDLIDLQKYEYYIAGERATTVVTMAGCPFSCAYCCHWKGYKKLACKSSSYVKREIQSIIDDYGIRGIMFYDDEINLRPDFMTEFVPMLKELNIVWRAFFKCGVYETTDEMFSKLAESGCSQLCTGAESANQHILNIIGKKSTVEQNTNFVKMCIKHGIRPKIFTQVGLPFETKETIIELRDWLISLVNEGLEDIDVSVTTLFKNTPMYDNPEKFGITILNDNITPYKTIPGSYKTSIASKNLTGKQIIDLRDWVEAEFKNAILISKLKKKKLQDSVKFVAKYNHEAL